MVVEEKGGFCVMIGLRAFADVRHSDGLRYFSVIINYVRNKFIIWIILFGAPGHMHMGRCTPPGERGK